MMKSKHKTYVDPHARMVGSLYLLLAVVASFSMIYVSDTLISSNIAETIDNIMASEGLFRMAIVGNLIAQVIQIFTVLGLYRLLSPVDKGQAFLMKLFVLLAVPIAMLNELNYFAILQLLGDPHYLKLINLDQLNAIVQILLDLHEHGIIIAHIFWGLWLLPMGYLIYRSKFLPKIIGILLIIGCFGYLVDFLIFTLYPHLNLTISQFTFMGELLLPLWLVIKGVNIEEWKKWVMTSP